MKLNKNNSIFNRVMNINSKRKLSKKLNDKGSSFVLVLVSVALIMIMVAIMFVMIFMQYKMLASGKVSRNNFYYLEEVLNEMRVGIGNQSMEDLKAAYDDTVSMVVSYDTEDQKYLTVSDETARNIMNNKYLENVAGDFMVSEETLKTILLSYVKNVQEADGEYLTSDAKVYIDFNDGFKCEPIEQASPKATIGYRITGITVSREDKKGNLQSISTDITIYPPEDALNFLASAQELGDVFTYSTVADYGLEIADTDGEGTASNYVTITGNLYVGDDRRNNGIYGGTVGENTITGSTSYVDSSANDEVGVESDRNTYSGIFVSGSGSTLKLQSDIIAVNGSITADNGGKIYGNTKGTGSSRAAQATLYARNIFTTGTDETGSTIDLNASFSISDDLEINNEGSEVYLSGTYFGYNFADQDDSKEITTANSRKHTNSSAIIINGKNTTLDLSQLQQLVVSGKSYIDLISAKSTATDSDDTNVDIETGESISIKSNQLVYRVTETGSITSNGSLKALNTTDADKPTYNLIKFLAYQFFEDDGNDVLVDDTKGANIRNALDKMHGYDTSVTSTMAKWTNKELEDVWKDIQSNGTSSTYYQDLMAIYFPGSYSIGKVSVPNGSDGKIDTEAAWETSTSVSTVNLDEYDAFNENAGELPTVNGNSVHRYGFITNGVGSTDILLATTKVRGTTYYYYLFYDDDARQEFAADYSKYTSSDFCSATVDDVTDPTLLNGADAEEGDYNLKLPTDDEDQVDTSTLYTSGLSTILNAATSKYELVPSAKVVYENPTQLKTQSDTVKNLAMVYKSYFPKNENQARNTSTMAKAATIYTTGERPALKKSHYTYTTSGDAVSPLTNPECVNINWKLLASKVTASSKSSQGETLTNYSGANVWLSDDDLTIDGNNRKLYGIIICRGNVTLKDVKEFTGTIITAGKLKIIGTTSFYTDEQMCTSMLENDVDNQFRTIFGLKEYTEANDDESDAKSISSITYEDLVGFDNWLRNGD